MIKNYSISAGDDLILNLTFKDEDEDPIDITHYEVAFCVKRYPSDTDSDAVYRNIITSHTSPSTGETVVSLPGSESSQLTPGNYYYIVKAKPTENDNPIRYMEGAICVSEAGVEDF